MADKKVYKTLCRMCDDHCGIDVHVEDGKVVKIEGNKDFCWNNGRICIKGSQGVAFQNHPDRILKPLKKMPDGSFAEISYKQAMEEIIEKLKTIREESGARSIGVWKGEAVGFAQQEELARRWVHAIGSPNYFSNDSACFAGRWIGYSLVYGRWNAQPDFDNSKCIICWGANPPYAHPNMTQQINRARANGAKLVCVDPRLSAMARQADCFVKIKPGSDGAFVWGLMNYMIEKGWVDHEFIKNYTIGYDKVCEYAKKFTFEYVSQEIGADAEEYITTVAKMLKDAGHSAVVYVGNGLEHHENGINNIRACAYLDAILGLLDHKGGSYSPVQFCAPDLTLYGELPLKHLEPLGADKFPVLYHYRQECHTMTLMNTLQTKKPYPIRAIVLTGANPAISNPNSLKVRESLAKLDLFVVHEVLMTETAKLADYILPAATYLERSELHQHGGYQVMTLTTKVLPEPEDVVCGYTMFHDLAHGLGAGEYFPWENEDELNKWLIESTGRTVETMKAHPSGYHYADFKYEKHVEKLAKGEKPFNTPSGKVEFTSALLKDFGYEEIAEYLPPESNKEHADFPFTLVTGARKVMYYHGRNHDIPSLASALKNPEVEIHPIDAEKLGIKTGDMVKVTTKIGTIDIPATVMNEKEIGVGVIQITHGWENANANKLTHDDVFDKISGFPLMKAVLAKVEKL